jgi:hypothetical protein
MRNSADGVMSTSQMMTGGRRSARCNASFVIQFGLSEGMPVSCSCCSNPSRRAMSAAYIASRPSTAVACAA